MVVSIINLSPPVEIECGQEHRELEGTGESRGSGWTDHLVTGDSPVSMAAAEHGGVHGEATVQSAAEGEEMARRTMGLTLDA